MSAPKTLPMSDTRAKIIDEMIRSVLPTGTDYVLIYGKYPDLMATETSLPPHRVNHAIAASIGLR